MNQQYTIYPVPQQVEYLGRSSELPREIRVQSNFDWSEGFEQRLNETLALQEIKRADNATWILKIDIDSKLQAELKDYYELEISENQIHIKAQHQAGAFYALTTLYHVIAQSDDHLICLNIRDYAQLQLRGLIEGYYGIPWSDESRKSIIHFGSYFKMNMYAFAPKDDPYHRDLWWELYPAEQLAVISSLARYGEACYNHYTWTIAPFKADANPIRDNNKEEGLAQLIAKFEQLYDAGVRQFGVLGDDVGNLPYDTVVYVMNAVNAWRKSKSDIGELIFCPEGYTMADWAFKDGSELNNYDSNFDPDIHIIFTGMSTCSPASEEAVREFKTKANIGRIRRDPLFWMNWPVNDIDRDTYRRLFMGKGEVYHAGVTDMSGMLTNPMEEAEASKVALFATLDYAWNTIAFNADQSWADSFAYIDRDAAAELHEVSKHMSEITNGALEDAEESVELAAKIQMLNDAQAKGGTALAAAFAEVKEAYQSIVDACAALQAKSKNAQLMKEMKAYLANLSDKSQAAILYLNAVETGDKSGLAKADELMTKAVQHFIVTRTAEFPSTELYAQTAAKVIDKHIASLRETLNKA